MRARATGFFVLALVASGCTSTPHPTTHGGRPAPLARAVATGLQQFGDCAQLTRAIRGEALKEVTAYGLQAPQLMYGRGSGVMGVDDRSTLASTGMAAAGGLPMPAPEKAAQAAAPAAGPGFSGTNNQEAGVDEPDLVKTNGTVMLVLRQQAAVLQLIDVHGAHPALLSKLPVALHSELSMLLSGTTVVVLGQRYEGNSNVTTAEVYDIADPTAPVHLRTFRIKGQLLDARFVHGRVVLATQTVPSLRFVYPGGPTTQAGALAANRMVISRADASSWLPAVVVTPHRRTYQAQCDAAYHPAAASGTGTTSIVTLDPQADAPTQNLTVVGGSNVLYASESTLYLATSSWRDQLTLVRGRGAGVTTALHGFDLTDPDHLRFLGSGSVPGSLTDQYSLSDQHGYLRVATTIGDPQPPTGEGIQPAKGQLSDNRITVLHPTGGQLAQVGVLTGLGRGQRIYGVRFLGDVGYVVTFRTIDPLYAIDLSDPRHPAVKGALHVSGYSSTLFPLADGQLLGIGQAVGARQQQLGAQAEVFDVSQLAHPRLTGKLVYPQAASSAENDHHALLWWGPAHLVVMPLQTWTNGSSQALVLKVETGGTLKELGRISAPHSAGTYGSAQITRSVVVGNLLYSVTDGGLVVNPLDEVDRQTWLPFA
ncbi:MAG: hypothetical protein JWL79_1143 [Frankiales bacterium]|nr:hypothetical protein [Frankiales bacterium]